MKINDAVFGVVLLALGVVVLWHVQSFPKIPGQNVGPALFPGSIAAGLIVCALLLIVSGLRSRPRVAWLEATAVDALAAARRRVRCARRCRRSPTSCSRRPSGS